MTTMTHEHGHPAIQKTDYVRTGCCALEILYTEEQAAWMRDLLIRSIGRDCICQEGDACAFLSRAVLAGAR